MREGRARAVSKHAHSGRIGAARVYIKQRQACRAMFRLYEASSGWLIKDSC
jgi:hypothetical protein